MRLTTMKELFDDGMSVQEIINIAGHEGADPATVRRILSATPSKTTKRSSSRSRKPRKTTNYAAQVLRRGRAMTELVIRVNEQPKAEPDEIPFDGRPGNSDDAPEGNGLAAGVDY